MPKNKKEDLIFTIIMVLFMCYSMICYSTICVKGMSNEVFLMALKELPIMWLIAFLLEFIIVSKLVHKIVDKSIDIKKTEPLIVTVLFSSVTVVFMCTFMSFIGSLLFNYNGIENIICNFLTVMLRNFSVALCLQLFFIGPLVRFIFRKIFK